MGLFKFTFIRDTRECCECYYVWKVSQGREAQQSEFSGCGLSTWTNHNAGSPMQSINRKFRRPFFNPLLSWLHVLCSCLGIATTAVHSTTMFKTVSRVHVLAIIIIHLTCCFFHYLLQIDIDPSSSLPLNTMVRIAVRVLTLFPVFQGVRRKKSLAYTVCTSCNFPESLESCELSCYIHMWQSCVEKGYSIAYFNHITVFETLYR